MGRSDAGLGRGGNIPLRLVWYRRAMTYNRTQKPFTQAPMPDRPSYPDRLNPDLLARIPLAARVVVDIGCHTGALGHAYRARNPNAMLLGVEADPATAAIAATRLDQVVCLDIETEELAFDLPNGADCLIYGDVLEHLRDPFAVLRKHLALLRPGGTVLICVPNVEHWSFTSRLLHGNWYYEASGLLDRTHMRWFSRASMEAGLRALGLHVCDVMPRIFNPRAAAPFLAAMAPALLAMGVDAAAYARRALPLQYIWRLQRDAPQRMHVAATALLPVGGVTDVRVNYPLQALATDPAIVVHISGAVDFANVPAGTAGIAVLHRPVLQGAEGLAVLRRLQDKGWLTVTEFDDHPDHFPAMRGADQFSFTGVHAVQTTTEPLAEILRARNPEVAVFANAIRTLPPARNFTDPDALTVFFGALNRAADWRDLLDTLNAVSVVAGERLRFEVVHDQAFYAGLITTRKNFTPTCDHATYLDILGGCEISFMPLADTAFNRAKSDLKYIEAAACRVVPLASPVVYARSIVDGKTGLIFHDAADLRARLLQLIAFPDMARTMADAARADIGRHRMMADQVTPRLAWYRDLWARRAALTDALRARVPALA